MTQRGSRGVSAPTPGIRFRTPAAVVLAVMAVTIVACAPLPEAVSMGGDAPSSVCVPVEGERAVVVGDTLQARGASVVRDVRLVDPEGLTVEEAAIVPISEGAAAIGAIWLDELEASGDADWASRMPAAEAVLTEGDAYTAAVVVRLDGTSGSADRIEVEYADAGGRTSVARGTTSFEFAPTCD